MIIGIASGNTLMSALARASSFCGTRASAMVLAAEGRAYPLGVALVLAIGAIVLVLAYAALRLAPPLGQLLRQTGVNVVTRVLGVLLAALAVQYVADGVRGLLAQ